ncbi:MAG TPA: ATP-binding protein [Vitreimonas sp.]|nr:ATP-binding protein [Vitreimonas sp.]
MAAVETAPIPPDEAERLKAVRRYDILDTPPDGAFDRITSLAARVFDVPIAIVSIVDHDRIWFKSHHGVDVDQIDREPGLCASAILHDGPWVVGDAPNDPRALTNSLVAGEFGLKFYAGVPLRTSDGYNLGTLCILDFKPRELSAQETATLEDLASMVLSELEVRLASRRAVAEAQERETIKDAFVGMMSHELRTPVTTIYAAAQMLSRNEGIKADPRARELFPDIASESERLMRLIENLLVLTRLEHGRLEIGQEPVLLQRVVPHAIHDAARRWPDRTITADISPDLPPVSGDQTYVEQVVSNLLSNALKYSADETDVELTVRAMDDEVEARVRDRGIGLDPARRNDVFDLLVRTDEATNYAPGAGIGLYVARRLLEAMNGRIWIETPADGPGTVFAFRLPVAKA